MTIVLGTDSTLQTVAASPWLHPYLLPEKTDLAVITVHVRGNEPVDSVTYGSVAADLIDADFSDFPFVYVYAIAKADLPAAGSHDLSVTFSGDEQGATSILFVGDVNASVLADMGSIPSEKTFVATGTAVDTSISLSNSKWLVIDAVVGRSSGAGFNPDDDQTLVFYGVYDSPRGAGSSYLGWFDGTATLGWSGGDSSGRIRHVVVAVELDASADMSELLPPKVVEAGIEVMLTGATYDTYEAGIEVMVGELANRPSWHPVYVWDEQFGWVPTFPRAIFDANPPYG